MRFLPAVLISFFSITLAFGQMHDGTFGNEWIQHNQRYYKLKVAKDGIYRLDKQVLSRDIPNFDQIPVQELQLFCLGKKVPFYVHAPNDNVEYIEFYGEQNKGALDVNLYRNPAHHFNPAYSLISDSAAYFLTWATPTTSNQQLQNSSSNFNNLPPKENDFMYESQVIFNTHWNKGKTYMYGVTQLSKGIFEYGEGYGSPFSQSQQSLVPTKYLANNSNHPATLQIHGTASTGWSYHRLQINVGNQTQSYQQFFSDSVYHLTINLPNNELSNGKSPVHVTGLAGATDQHSLSKVSIRYPRQFNFDGAALFKFEIAAATQKKYLEIENFDGGNSGNQAIYLYDLTNHLRIHCFWDGAKVRVVLPPSATTRQLVLANVNYSNSISHLSESYFEDYRFSRGNYIVISHPQLYQNSQGDNPVLDYCAYRHSTGHQPSLHSIQELYDQFSYGIEGHPLAIKNFIAYVHQNWQNNPPKNVFIIGKGRNYTAIRNFTAADHLIPSFGYPASDNLLAAPLGSDIPLIPIGRLAATTGDEVSDYLEKIKAHELGAASSTTHEDQLWRKQIIHLAGGSTAMEDQLFKLYINKLKKRVDEGIAGSTVHSFSKNTDQAVTVSNSLMIDSLINNGVAMISFFGHGSVTNFDYYLNKPDDYHNKNRYPLIFAMGCYNGTIYEEGKYMSENFVFKKDAGAAAYLSFVNIVMAHAASDIGDQFYKESNGSSYGEGIGTIIKNTLQNITALPSGYSPSHQIANNYLVFHGDPAIKLNYRNTPDYSIAKNALTTYPATISSQDRHFKLLIDVHNLGKYRDTLINLKVIRYRPLGKVDTHYVEINAPKDKIQVELLLAINGLEDLGVNKFSVFVDSDDKIAELPHPLAEQNNILLEAALQIGHAPISAIYPRDLAIISHANLRLKAATTNAFETNQTWVIELDTTKFFNSPKLIQTTTQSIGNQIEWTPSVTLQNKQVYYWRVSTQTPQQATSDWSIQSFIYLENAISEGWNQSHVYQYQQNEFDQMYASNEAESPLHFAPSLYEIAVKTGFIPDALAANDLALYQNGSVIDKCRCQHKNGVYVAVFDPNQLEFWTLPAGNNPYGAVNCDPAGRTASAFLFETNTLSGHQSLSNFIQNRIPAGHLVLVYTLNNAFGAAWPSNLVQYLKQEGANQVDAFVANTTGNQPYAFAFKKGLGSDDYFSEKLGASKQEAIHLIATTPQAWHEGAMTSSLIGPAQHWDLLEWQTNSLETTSNDIVTVNLWGIHKEGARVLLHRAVNNNFDLSHINSKDYPYLQLEMNSLDEQDFSPAQLDYWRVWALMETDLSLVVGEDYTFDTIQDTEEIILDLSVFNGSSYPIHHGELLISILGQDSTIYTIPNLNKLKAANMRIKIPMTGLSGPQHLVAQIIPLAYEKNLSNNWAWFDFYVENNLDVAVHEIESSATQINALRNYPNPFIEQTTLEFQLEDQAIQGQVSFEIYDVRGALIERHQQTLEANNQWTWNNSSIVSGVYYALIKVNEKPIQTLKMVKE